MTPEELREDAEYAHAVFDLCGIKTSTRGTQPASLRLRASMLAEKAGVVLSQEQIDEQRKKRSGSN